MNQITKTTGNAEWYTPHVYLEAARAVLGGIDLDPASSYTANKLVKAKLYFTKEQNGLTKPWKGKVWLNPPYTRNIIDKFIAKLIHHAERDEVKSYICLVNAAMDTKWAHALLKNADSVCFIKGRISFLTPAGQKKGKPPIGQMLAYKGVNQYWFDLLFRKYGAIVKPE